jgi:tetratricopeptide (TPR) repeat protein
MESFFKIFAAASIAMVLTVPAAASEKESYLKIKKIMSSDRSNTAANDIENFTKKYPASRNLPELLFLSASNEQNPDRSIEKHRKCFFMKAGLYSELSALKVCQILHMKSSWKELKEISQAGLSLNGKYRDDFRKFTVEASMMTGDFPEADAQNKYLLDNIREYNTLAGSLIARSYIKKNTGGFSRDYIYTLRETAIGFYESEYMPTALYLLGEFYENSGDYDRAWSAYSDLTAHFPESPESEYAADRTAALMKHKPSRKGYIPTEKIVKSAPSLDISPESEYENTEGSSYYAVSIGPFDASRDADRIRKLPGLSDSKKAKTRSGYSIFAGRFSSREEAYRMKIRLAEEFGLNGHITRITEKGGRAYIYGE